MSFLTPFDEDALFRMADADGDGVIGPADAAFFSRTLLPKDTLKQIWDATVTNRGMAAMRRDAFRHALLLVSLAQTRRSITTSLSTCGPLPAPILYANGLPQPLPGATAAAASVRQLAPLTPQERAAYEGQYDQSADTPQGVSGTRARLILSTYGLSVDTLSRVWAASDMDRDGHLSRREFALAMALIAHCRAGGECPLSAPPAVLASLPAVQRPNYNVQLEPAFPAQQPLQQQAPAEQLFPSSAQWDAQGDLFQSSPVDWGTSSKPSTSPADAHRPSFSAAAPGPFDATPQSPGALSKPTGTPSAPQPTSSPAIAPPRQASFILEGPVVPPAASASPAAAFPASPAASAFPPAQPSRTSFDASPFPTAFPATASSPGLGLGSTHRQSFADMPAVAMKPASPAPAAFPPMAALPASPATPSRESSAAALGVATAERSAAAAAVAAAIEAAHAAEREMREEEARLAELTREAAKLQQQAAEAQHSAEASREAAARAREQSKALAEQIEDASGRVKSLQAEHEESTAEAQKLASEREAKQAELDELEEREQGLEESIRADKKRMKAERARIAAAVEAIEEVSKRVAQAEAARRKAAAPPEWLASWEPSPSDVFGKAFAVSAPFADPKADPFGSDAANVESMFPAPLDQFSSV